VEHVTLLVRGGSIGAGMSAYLVDQIAETPNISVRLHASVTAVRGDQALDSIEVADSETGTSETLPVAAMFVFIGQAPRTDWLSGLVERDQAGFVVTGPGLTRAGDKVPGWPLAREPFILETSVPGIFCAGDVRSRSVKRIASAVGEGSMAIQFVHQHLAGL
jgi:thioredoxin reductase (NADPH)